jgi:hypothetical protein
MPRNAAGLYTLPLPPVIPNTVIESDWANTTVDDLASAISDSLSRTGQGGMTAPFRLIDGTVGTPSLAFIAEPSSGLYRQSSGVVAMTIQGSNKQTWNTNGTTVIGTTTLQGDVSITGILTATGVVGPLTLTSLSVVGDLIVAGVSTLGVVNTTGKVTVPASTTASAFLNLPHGATPTTPVNGDMWTLTGGLTVRLNGANRTMATIQGANTFTAANIFSSTFAANGGVTLGDAAGDALTINSSTATIPAAGINFTGGFFGINRAPTAQLDVMGTPASTAQVCALVYNAQSNVTASMCAMGTANVSHGPVPFSAVMLSTGSGNTPMWIGNWQAGTGGISLMTNGAERARLSDVGWMTIGKAGAPNAVLDIQQTPGPAATGVTSILLNNSTLGVTMNMSVASASYTGFPLVAGSAYISVGSGNTPMAFGQVLAGTGTVSFFTNATKKMEIDTSGNVLVTGVSTASGATYVSLQNTQTTLTGAMIMVGSTFASGGVLGSSFLVSPGAGNTNMSVGQYLTGTGSLLFHTNGAERMRIAPEGNVGVNLVPASLGAGITGLSANGTTQGIVEVFAGGVRIGTMSGLAAQMIVGSVANVPLQLWTNNAEKARITVEGNVGIGTTTPTNYGATSKTLALNTTGGSAVFEGLVSGTKAGSVVIGSTQVVIGSDTGFNTPVLFITNGSEKFRVINTGGVQTGLPGTGTAFTFLVAAGVAGFISHPTTTTTAYNTSSDARLKRNVRPVKDVGRIIDNIPVVSFDWKTDGIHVPVGLIAQDVHGVFPQAVHEGGSNADTDPWALDHSKLVPLLLKEIQSLRERVAVLEDA